jgi:hypothetical protein
MGVPRMHRESKPGEATPTEAESIVGANVDFDKISTAAVDGEERIYRYVQEPLRKWLANFDTVVVRVSYGWNWQTAQNMLLGQSVPQQRTDCCRGTADLYTCRE